jgi:hypothetical protein
MPVVPILVGVAAVATVGGAYMQYEQGKKAAKAAKRANKFERQKSDLQSARQKIEALRAGRQAMAQAQQNAENQGVSGSSIGQGGAGSIYSQTAGNLSFLDQYGYFSDQASASLQKAANAEATGRMWGAVSDLGSKAFQAMGGFTGPTPPAG